MALVGLKYIVAAPLSEESDTNNTYGSGFVVGKAVTANVSVTTAGATLYADDALAEQDDSVTGGDLDLVTSDISDDVQTKLLGHTKDEESGEITANINDVAVRHGVGFYAKKMVDGTVKYRAIWITKVQFSEPSENLQTKGSNTSFVTPTLPGAIMVPSNGNWKKEQTFGTESEAVSYLNQKANITATTTE